jgi:hypothetical protein
MLSEEILLEPVPEKEIAFEKTGDQFSKLLIREILDLVSKTSQAYRPSAPPCNEFSHSIIGIVQHRPLPRSVNNS